MRKTFLTGTVAAAAIIGAALLGAVPASAQSFSFGMAPGGIGFSYDSGGYCDQSGCPDDFWDYPVSYCPVFFRGQWYDAPLYYREDRGEYVYWIHDNWRRDQWEGPRPPWACMDRFGPPLGLDFYESHGFRIRSEWRDRWSHDRNHNHGLWNGQSHGYDWQGHGGTDWSSQWLQQHGNDRGGNGHGNDHGGQHNNLFNLMGNPGQTGGSNGGDHSGHDHGTVHLLNGGSAGGSNGGNGGGNNGGSTTGGNVIHTLSTHGQTGGSSTGGQTGGSSGGSTGGNGSGGWHGGNGGSGGDHGHGNGGNDSGNGDHHRDSGTPPNPN